MKPEKNYDIECWRFIGILTIVYFHVYWTGITYGSYHLANGWLFTDMFFVLTGYFTSNHFARKQGTCLRDVFQYCGTKANRYLPYIIPSVILSYLVQCFSIIRKGSSWRNILKLLLHVPVEISLLTSSYDVGINDAGIPSFPLNAPLWFLSALFIVLPLFCWIMSLEKYDLRWMICFVGGILSLTCDRNRFYFTDLKRAFLGLCMGGLIFFLKNTLEDQIHGRQQRYALWGGYISLTICWVVAFFNINISIFFLLMDAGVFLILISNQTFIKTEQEKKVVGFLGCISMPLFIWHWPIASIIQNISNLTEKDRKILFVLFSLIISVCVFEINMIYRRKFK